MYDTPTEFLQEVQRRAGLDSIQEADRIARVIIGLIKSRIPSEVSEQIARSVPRGLARVWLRIELPEDTLETRHMLDDLDESPEAPKARFSGRLPLFR